MKNWNSEDILYIMMKSDRALVSAENIRDINL